MTTTTHGTTTLHAYAGKRAHGYDHNPKVDVPILPDVHRCQCGKTLEWVAVPLVNAATGWRWTEHVWTHTGEGWHDLGPGNVSRIRANTDHAGFVGPVTRCRYCHTADPDHITVTHYAWYTATECARCGGITGWGTGD